MKSLSAEGHGLSRRSVVLIVGAVVLVLVAAAAWVGIRALLVKSELEALVPIASELEDAAATRDLERLSAAVTELSAHAEQASAMSGDPIWRVAEFTPWIGPNLGAARVVSANLASISEAAVPLMEAVESAVAPATAPTGFDVAALARVAQPLQQTSNALTAAEAEFAQLESAELVGPLASGVQRLADVTAESAPVVASLASASQVLPSLLGAEDERHLLVMLQNSAEPRTGGGITGSFALLRADNGSIELIDQADGGEFPGRAEPIAPVPASSTALYGERIGRFVQNTSMPSDFAATAALATAWWATRSDVEPDAVLSIDLPAIRAMLSASGPIVLSDGSEITAENIIRRVLIDPYLTLDLAQQTAYQRELTAALMSGLFSRQIDVFAWLEAMAEPIEQGRISLWSARPDEEAHLETGPLAGPAARHAAAGGDSFAVYFNDATSGKMGSFVDVSLSVGTAQCRADGKSDAVVAVSITNNAPTDAGTALPWWLTGGGLEGVTPGHIRMNVTVSAPPGSFFGGVRADGERTTSANVEDEGFPASAAVTTVPPGETSVLEFRFVMDSDRDVAPTLLHTPLIGTPEVATAEASCE